MGIFGWNLLEFEPNAVPQIGEDVILKGLLVKYYTQFGTMEDGDWNLVVVPDKEFDHLLINSDEEENKDVYPGDTTQKIIECEVHPIPQYHGEEYAVKFLKPLVGKRILVTGSFVEDVSHDNKTEIHPITAIVCEEEKVGFKQVTLIAFSDASENNALPNTGINRTLKLDIPFENKPSKKNFRKLGKYQFIGKEINLTESLSPLKVILKKDYAYLQININTGEPMDGKGFYYAKIKLFF